MPLHFVLEDAGEDLLEACRVISVQNRRAKLLECVVSEVLLDVGSHGLFNLRQYALLALDYLLVGIDLCVLQLLAYFVVPLLDFFAHLLVPLPMSLHYVLQFLLDIDF